jgi:hypothetical protein
MIMKKIFAMLLALLMLCLCACGAEAPAQEDAQLNVTPKVEETLAPTEEVKTPEETTAETAEPAQDLKALAESCIDKDVSELFALIGEPESADYAPSCLVEGGEDGMLYYDGFVVYTTRDGDVETVTYVE